MILKEVGFEIYKKKKINVNMKILNFCEIIFDQSIMIYI